jgi:DDE superfamily endonuclease
MRRPRSRPATAVIPACRPGGPAPRPWNTNTTAAGALAYLAAYDVGRAKVFGHTAPATGIEPFMALVEQVMTAEPYASARRVFWIVVGGSSHRGKAAIKRLSERFPTAVMVHTPVHASWLNQVEIYFSMVQRKVVTPNDFMELGQVERRLLAFQERYNATARPFDWTFTKNDLDDLLVRIEGHERPHAQAPAIRQAA